MFKVIWVLVGFRNITITGEQVKAVITCAFAHILKWVASKV